MTLRLNRRSERGLVPHVPPKGQDWRMVLRSRAWRARRPGFWARQTGQPWSVRSLDNPAPEPVSPALGVIVFTGLAMGTFVVLVVFRLLGIWS